MATMQQKWISKAEDNYSVALFLNRTRKQPLPDIVCFHCREFAQKYLIACLIGRDIPASPEQGLPELLQECTMFDPTLSALSVDAMTLSPYDESVVYPDYSGKAVNAQEAVEAARRIRTALRRSMRL